MLREREGEIFRQIFIKAPSRRKDSGAWLGAARGSRRPAPLGIPGSPELAHETAQVCQATAPKTRHHRPVEPVQKLPAAPAPHEKSDEVACGSVVKNPHPTHEDANGIPDSTH